MFSITEKPEVEKEMNNENDKTKVNEKVDNSEYKNYRNYLIFIERPTYRNDPNSSHRL